ncbi:hypothetical protein CC86DRAFT_375520 [Ophiobolus disseminans]|uniref:C2H2-type domain-containing protein n=1 Tax=Ophiobolus disseminans TaxID=1469910 RepID=A0A6A6ZDD6_9PLEO|nr:hypothetical protein CC86DRAFT_375520 [Ophiobolus disseminans]
MVVAPEPLGPFNSGVPLLPGAGAPFAIGFDYLDDFTGIGQSNFLNTTPQQIAHNHFTPNVTEPYLDFGVDPEPQQNQDFYQQALNGSELDFVTGAWMPNHSAYQPMWPTAPQLDMTLDAGLHQAVAPAPPAPAPSNIPLPTRAVGHACLNCQKTFKRAGDYRRHMRSYAAPQFHCFVQGCTKAFTRKDKRRDHMRQGHKLAV